MRITPGVADVETFAKSGTIYPGSDSEDVTSSSGEPLQDIRTKCESESDSDNNATRTNHEEVIRNNSDAEDKIVAANKLGNLILHDDPKSAMMMTTMKNDVTKSDSSNVPVRVLAANLQQFYERRSKTQEGPTVRGKPPQVPRKPIVTEAISKKFVTKVDISDGGQMSKEDAEAVAVLDHSIAMSERQMKSQESQSDNLIEEIVIATSLKHGGSGPFSEDILARRSHELAKQEINGLLGAEKKLSFEPSNNEILFADEDAHTEVEHRSGSSNSSTDSGVPECREPLLVAAIDLGTTYSGYAFSFTRDPENIRVMKKSETFWIHKNKQPTCVLLKPTGEFYSFGFNAQMNYHDLESADDKQNWMYFDKFKMALHNTKNLTLDTEIKAINGMKVRAIIIFTHVLRYFKSLVLDELTDSTGTRIRNEDVRWVITVPAIWRQPAKQFMRTAAYQAGLASPENPNQILIALEPEAASLYCRKLKIDQLVHGGNAGNKSDEFLANELQNRTMDKVLNIGTRYMVVDCGGGTVDITVYEVENTNGNLKELHKASGGPYGSVGVDKEFELLLQQIFGAPFIEKYKNEVPEGFVYLMLKFESRKLSATTSMTKPLNIELPYTFIQSYQKFANNMGGSGILQTAVENCGIKGVTFSSTGMLRLIPDVMLRLFKPTVAGIKQHISEVLLQPRVRDITYLFLVGGFAESQILQAEVKSEFSSSLTVIIPRDVSVSILQGAVLFGLDPSIVSVRCSRMTYGVGILNKFNPNKHPKEKLIVKDQTEWCTDIFDKFVCCNQSIGLGETVRRSYTPASPKQKFLVLHVYMSEEENPRFITDSGVLRCGTLALDLRDSECLEQNVIREIQAIMTFGDTEIKASAMDVTSNKCVGVDVDFFT